MIVQVLFDSHARLIYDIQRIEWLRKEARSCNFQLVPAPPVCAPTIHNSFRACVNPLLAFRNSAKALSSTAYGTVSCWQPDR